MKIFRNHYTLVWNYNWILYTSTYDGIYFNDFIFFGLKQEILSRVIIHQMSGSSWYFRRFISLAVKILDDATEAVI